MNVVAVSRAIPITLAAVGAIALGAWLVSARVVTEHPKRVPLEDKSVGASGPAIDFANGIFKTGDGKVGKLKGDWPWFRGQNLDNIATDPTPLARQFPAAGPVKVWEVPVGEGYAGPIVRDGRLYLMDYEEETRSDILRCLSTDDGKEIWRRGYPLDIGRNHGFSRTVCAIANGLVVTFGPKCHVMCVDAVSGELKWAIDLVRQYKAKVPDWYAGQNPLIDGDKVILAPGNEALLIAVELATGKVLWKTPNPNNWEMTHSSVVPMMFKGKKIYLYCASGALTGVSAEDGRLLFEYGQWKVSMANVPTPLPIPGERVFLTGGYGAGAMMIKLEEAGGKIIPKMLFKLTPEVFGIEQHTPVLYKEYIYGVVQNSAQVVCLSLDGKVMWTSGGKYRFSREPYMIADGLLILMNDKGTLTLAEATEKAWTPLATGKVFEHCHEAWGPLALVSGRLFARDMGRLACFDLRKVTP